MVRRDTRLPAAGAANDAAAAAIKRELIVGQQARAALERRYTVELQPQGQNGAEEPDLNHVLARGRQNVRVEARWCCLPAVP